MNYLSLQFNNKPALVNRETLSIHIVKAMWSVKSNFVFWTSNKLCSVDNPLIPVNVSHSQVLRPAIGVGPQPWCVVPVVFLLASIFQICLIISDHLKCSYDRFLPPIPACHLWSQNL